MKPDPWILVDFLVLLWRFDEPDGLLLVSESRPEQPKRRTEHSQSGKASTVLLEDLWKG